MWVWIGRSSGIRRLLYISGALTFLCLVGVISYLTALQFGSFGSDNVSSKGGAAGHSGTQETISGGSKDALQESLNQNPLSEAAGSERQPVLNLIYGYSEKKHKLTALILEIWNQTNGTLSYLTIPPDTGYTISKELYQKLSAIQPEVPQMMRFSGLYQYFESEDAFAYGCAVIGELLGTEVPRYTALPSEKLKEYFKKNKKGVWKLKQEFRAELVAWQEYSWEEQEVFLEETITELYSSMKTNHSLEKRIDELSFYKRISLEEITCQKLPGAEKNAGYEVDLAVTRQQAWLNPD